MIVSQQEIKHFTPQNYPERARAGRRATPTTQTATVPPRPPPRSPSPTATMPRTGWWGSFCRSFCVCRGIGFFDGYPGRESLAYNNSALEKRICSKAKPMVSLQYVHDYNCPGRWFQPSFYF